MTLPRGAFPFYDVVVETPETGYSPRDAYGEGYWSSWRDIWEVVQPNKFDIVPSRPDSDIELLQRLARHVYTEGRDWLHRAALMRELVRQKELETASKEDLEELKTSLDSWDPRVTSLDLDLRLRVEHWLATNSGAG